MIMNVEEFKKLYHEVDDSKPEVFEDFTVEVVEQGNWISDGKWESKSTIFKVTKNNNIFDIMYYEVYETRSGSYWTDYEYEEPQIQQVKPVEVVVTKWEHI